MRFKNFAKSRKSKNNKIQLVESSKIEKMEDPKTDIDIEGCLHVPLQQKK